MPNLVNRLQEFLRTPKGRATMEKISREAAKPENRKRIEQAREKLAKWNRPTGGR